MICSTGSALIFNAPLLIVNEYFPLNHPWHVLTTSLPFCGLANYLLIILFSGGIFDAFGSFHVAFFINGGLYFLSGILYLSIILLNKYQPTFIFSENSVKESENEKIEENVNIATSKTVEYGTVEVKNSIINSE